MISPTFSDFFKSIYYSNTYVSPVDLSEQGLSKYLLENEDKDTAAVAQKLISEMQVQQVLSEPLAYDLITTVPEKNAILEQQGFELLNSKVDPLSMQRVPYYSVVKHDKLQGWVIKSGAVRVPKINSFNDRHEIAFFGEEESLLRIEMANRIQKIAQGANIAVVLPKKKLVAYANSNQINEPTRKYCVVCEKINILSVEKTVQAIKDMETAQQKEIARNIATLVQKAGIVDASFDNIRLTPDGELAIIDTKPAGLMVAKKAGLKNKLYASKGASVEKCARIGLFTLMNQALKGTRSMQINGIDAFLPEPGLEAFHAEVKSYYEKATAPKLSKWKIALGITSLGVLPLMHVIVALVKTKLAERTFKKLQAIDTGFALQNLGSLFQPPTEQSLIEYQNKRTPVAKLFYSYIEGVPYKTIQLV